MKDYFDVVDFLRMITNLPNLPYGFLMNGLVHLRYHKLSGMYLNRFGMFYQNIVKLESFE